MTALEKKVQEALDANLNYLVDEPDPLKWAIAWRLTRDKNKIDANAKPEDGDAGKEIDGWMMGWFANAMSVGMGKVASAHEERIAIFNYIDRYTQGMSSKYDHPSRILMGEHLRQAIANGFHMVPDYEINFNNPLDFEIKEQANA